MKTLSNSVLLEFHSYNTPSHEKAKPPKQSYFYFPTERETVEFDKTNPMNVLRRIFEGGVQYNSFEKENLDKFAHFLEKSNFTLPTYWEKENTLRFLQANGYDYEKAFNSIKVHIEWRLKCLPVNPTDNVKKLLNLGFFYIHGRDNRFRPIIVLNPEIFVNNLNKYGIDEWLLTLIYLLEYTKQQCLLPGQIENWTIICDVGKSSILSLPKELKLLLAILQNNYRCRLYSMYILNVSLFIKVLWKTISIGLDQSTQRKIKLLQGDGDIEREVFKNINKAQIERRFGGLADDIVTKFFPPIFPSDDFFTSEDDKKVCVDESKYFEIINTSQTYKRSPFLFNVINLNDNNTKKTLKRGISDIGDSTNSY